MSNTKKCSRCLALNYDGDTCSFCGNGAGAIQHVTPEPMRVHHLKTHPEPFGAILDGDKNFEFRKNDRDFVECDLIVLQEYDPAEKTYSGRTISARVGHILRAPAYGVPKGYVCFSLLKIQF